MLERNIAVQETMREPYLTEFRQLIESGASGKDIHDCNVNIAYAIEPTHGNPDYVDREIGRVTAHQTSLCPLLEAYVGRANNVLDVGCGSGGTTVAMALSRVLAARTVTGVDVNHRAIAAAAVRAKAHGLSEHTVQFLKVSAGSRLPFADGLFDLVTCVSVLEFISSIDARSALVSELIRVARPGGYIFLATPNGLRLTEYHSGRILGNLVRREGYPWEMAPWAARKLFRSTAPVNITPYAVEQIGKALGLRGLKLPHAAGLSVECSMPWLRFLRRKPF